MTHHPRDGLLFMSVLLLPLCVRAAEEPAIAPEGFECPKIDKPYLHIPIKDDAPEVRLLVKIDGEQPYHPITVKLAQGNPDWNGMISVEQWMGRKLTIVPEKPQAETGWIRNMTLSDRLPDEESVYKEKYRPQFHFAARRGWINDVNGPVYLDGVYHLPFQHAPWRLQDSGDKVWGHAISKDLIHWEELGPMLSLARRGSSWSGSTAIDWYNTAGLVKNPVKGTDGRLKNPALVAFTNHGGATREEFVVAFFYSLDSARTWIYYPGNPVIPNHSMGNRDPHVLWYEDKADPASSHWAQVLYSGGGEEYLFYTSKDLIHWEHTGEFNGAGGSECPDLFQIPLDGDRNNMKWIFWCGNGNYSIGYFDGKTFKKESGPFRTSYSGEKSGKDYAAQAFANIPPADGRHIYMAWMAGGQFPGMPFTQQLTLPRVLTLRTTRDGPRFFIQPVKEVEALRTGLSAQMIKPLDGSDMQLLEERPIGELVDIDAVFTIHQEALTAEGDNQLGLEVNGQKVACVLDKDNQRDRQKMEVNDSEAPLLVVDGKIKLRVILDRMSIEVFANDGAVQVCRNFVPSDLPTYAIKAFGKKGLADVELKAYQLQSIWKKK